MTDKIRKEIALVDWKDNNAIIDFFESNKLYFDNIKSNADLNKIQEDIDIIISYCYALIDKCYFSKGLEIIPGLNILLNQVENKNSNEFMLRYEQYLFAEGLMYARLNKIAQSQSSFKELVKIDPNNDNYRGWFQSNKTKLLQKQTNIIGFFGFGIIMLDIILNTLTGNSLGQYTSMIGLLIMTISFSFPFFWGKFKK